MYNEEALLVKVVLKLIAEHLVDDNFDVVRYVAITSTFDEKLSPEAQQFVLNNIYIPKGMEHKCSISKMGELHDALEIRTTF